ncbi:MAG TPA: hypothetical protein VK612_08785 [Pyrinomonadaceae bacterium]|nr:hypothetical protein [Pyrinomonadaceae bacterium]
MELELPTDFKELFKSLNSNKVEYLLIGGYAVIIHGYVRNTSDLDLVVSRDAENAARCVNALTEFGFAGPDLKDSLFASPEKNLLRMGVAPVKIEILNYLEGVDFVGAYARRISKDVEEIQIDVISLEDLIKNKTEVGRLQDLLDVEKLRERNDL